MRNLEQRSRVRVKRHGKGTTDYLIPPSEANAEQFSLLPSEARPQTTC